MNILSGAISMKKYLKFIISFFIVLLISGCEMIGGSMNPISSSISFSFSFNPNYPGNTSSSSSINWQPSSSSKVSSSNPSSNISSSTTNENEVTPISQIINEAKYYYNSEKVYVAEGIVVARDYSGRPLIMDDYGNTIYVYSTKFASTIGNRLRIKGTISNYNGLIEFSTNTELLDFLGFESFSYPSNYIEYSAMDYINYSSQEMNGYLYKISDVKIEDNGSRYKFVDDFGNKILSYGLVEDVPYLCDENIGNRVDVYGFYYGTGKIIPAWVEPISGNNGEHEHNFVPKFDWTGDREVPVNMYMVCNDCGKYEDYSNYSTSTLILESSDPTCYSSGYMVCRGTITHNGHEYSEEQWIYLDILSHEYEKTVYEANKDRDGYTKYKCYNCGEEYHDDYVPRLTYYAPNDIEAPRIIKAQLLNDVVHVGDFVTVEFEIEDESTIENRYIEFSNYGHSVGATLENEEDNFFRTRYYIGDDYVPGTYRLNYMWITDIIGNYNVDSLPNLSFEVINENSNIVIDPNDNEAPKIVSFEIDEEVHVGDTLRLEVEIEDDSSIYSKYVQFNCYAHTIGFDLFHVEGNIYAGELYIGEEYIPSTYKLSYIWLTDYLGNAYSQELPEVSFTVINENSSVVVAPNDTSPPVVISYKLDKTEVREGDIVRVEFVIEDESSIYDMFLQFKNGNSYEGCSFYSVGNNTYVGEIYIHDRFMEGTYEVDWFTIGDYAANYNYNEKPNLKFTVVK